MIWERSRTDWSAPLWLVALVAGVALCGLTVDGTGSRPLERLRLTVPRPTPALSERLATVDAAIASKDVSRAVYEWRDAYGVALGSRRWEAMIALADAAVRIDALAAYPPGRPTGFRAEARQAYLRALFQARSDRAPEGIERAALAFATLGDAEMAVRARAIVVTR